MAGYTLNNSSIHPTYFLPTRQLAKTCSIPCSWSFRLRIRLMNLPMPQLSLKADLPVGFPYSFEIIFIILAEYKQKKKRKKKVTMSKLGLSRIKFRHISVIAIRWTTFDSHPLAYTRVYIQFVKRYFLPEPEAHTPHGSKKGNYVEFQWLEICRGGELLLKM